MTYEPNKHRGGGAADQGGSGSDGRAPGKRTRTEEVVQRKARPGAASEGDVTSRAAEGVSGAGESLPFLGEIASSFGAHDVSNVRAHTGERAHEAATAIGAGAYTTGNDVAFAAAPDLHTAAHEAAHVVQQRSGVELPGGVGQAGDAYERHADAVADAVVAGRSAEPLLDRHAGGGARASAVQRITAEDLMARGARLESLVDQAPTEGINLWVVTHGELRATIFLLGTEHALHLSDVRHASSVIAFLQGESFTHVFTETPARLPNAQVHPNLGALVENKQRQKQALSAAYPHGQPDLATDRANALAYRLASRGVEGATAALGDIDTAGLDDAYTLLAGSGPDGRAKKSLPAPSNLETIETRIAARRQNVSDLGVDERDPQSRKRLDADPSEVQESDAVKTGNQRALFREVANELMAGRDIASAEQRNKQWVDRLPEIMHPGDKQLWIVGAAHLPGLILRFSDLGWVVQHRGLIPPSHGQAGGGAASASASSSAASSAASAAATSAASAASSAAAPAASTAAAPDASATATATPAASSGGTKVDEVD